MPRSKPGGPSSTQDSLDHHTSPISGPQPTGKYPGMAEEGGEPKHSMTSREERGEPQHMSGKRQVTGKLYNPKLPDHVVKHPNPVGRPKNPRY